MTAHDPALVETIAEAIGVADDYIWGLLTPDEQEPHFIRARAVLDAITTSPRRALVELPEPTFRSSTTNIVMFPCAVSAWPAIGTLAAKVRLGTAIKCFDFLPTEAPHAAAALLAAARAAESGSTTPENQE